MVSAVERIDRWIDALCAGVKVYEDRALDPAAFEREEDILTEEILRSPLPRMISSLS